MQKSERWKWAKLDELQIHKQSDIMIVTGSNLEKICVWNSHVKVDHNLRPYYVLDKKVEGKGALLWIFFIPGKVWSQIVNHHNKNISLINCAWLGPNKITLSKISLYIQNHLLIFNHTGFYIGCHLLFLSITSMTNSHLH